MHCPDLRRFAAAAIASAALVATAAPEAAKSEIAARLARQLPAFSAADYALGSAAFDPELRAKVEENAANTPAVIEAGRAIWTRKFKDGRTLASCFPNGGRRIAAVYPQYDPRLKRVISLETAVNQCLKGHAEALLDAGDAATMGVVLAYLRSLSNGQKIAVRVPPAAEERFEQGRRFYFTRMGQRNFACASCHVQAAGKRYADTPLSPVIGQAARWPTVRGGSPVTLQASIRECLERMGAAPFAAGSDELATLEYFITYLSNAMAIRVNGAAAR